DRFRTLQRRARCSRIRRVDLHLGHCCCQAILGTGIVVAIDAVWLPDALEAGNGPCKQPAAVDVNPCAVIADLVQWVGHERAGPPGGKREQCGGDSLHDNQQAWAGWLQAYVRNVTAMWTGQKKGRGGLPGRSWIPMPLQAMAPGYG